MCEKAHHLQQNVSGNKKRCDGRIGKLATLIGCILQLLLVALPRDMIRWLRLRRKQVRGQTIVITGAASGIGQRLAELLANPVKMGANVAIIDANLEGANRVVQRIRTDGGKAMAWKCDISDANAMRLCAAEIRTHFGRVDIVICNAAVLYFAYAHELKDTEIERALAVNVLGTINTIRAFLPDLEAQGHGQLVTIASITSFFGETFGMAYCPTKFAVRGAMDCLRMELRDRGLEDAIACTTICPYFVRTPMILAKGLRPVSRWIPFMSVERCANEILDALLKEKVLAFIPPWLSLLTLLYSLFSLNMQKVARDFIDCRYEELDETSQKNQHSVEAVDMEKMEMNKIGPLIVKCALGEEGQQQMKNGANIPQPGTIPPSLENGEQKKPMQQKINLDDIKQHFMGKQRQMQDYFQFAHPLWWLLILPGMLLTFITFYAPGLLNVPWLSFIGQFAYNFGTQHPEFALWLNIFAWSAHSLEAVAALYLADALKLSHKSSFLWFAQTMALGFPSLRLLLKKLRAKEKY